MRLAALTLVCVLCVSAHAEDRDEDVVRTLAAGLRSHESAVPPLTATFVAVWDYTPEYFAKLESIALLRPDAKAGRSAVAMSVLERSDAEWEVEAQGLIRGYNPIVPPNLSALPEQVTDLYRLTVSDGQAIIDLSRSNLGPIVSAQTFADQTEGNSTWGTAREWLGLRIGRTPSALVEACIGRGAAGKVLSLQEREGRTFVLRAAFTDPQLRRYTVTTATIDADHFCLREYRWVVVNEKDGRHYGTGTHIVWDQLQPLAGADVWLPRSMTRWRVHDDGQGESLRAYTQQVRVCQLVATAKGSLISPVPRWLAVGARLDPQALQDVPELAAAYARAYGSLRSPETEALLGSAAPPPPTGLTDEVHELVMSSPLAR